MTRGQKRTNCKDRAAPQKVWGTHLHPWGRKQGTCPSCVYRAAAAVIGGRETTRPTLAAARKRASWVRHVRHPPVVVSAGARARRCPEAGWLRLGRPPRRGRLPGRRPCRAAAGSIGSDRFRQRISLSQVAADSPLCPGGHGGGHWRKEEGMCICQLRPLPWPLLARWPTELANVAAEDRPQIAGRPRPRACGVGAGGGGTEHQATRGGLGGPRKTASVCRPEHPRLPGPTEEGTNRRRAHRHAT